MQKIPFGVDPKTVLCAFYKAGNCDKGNKCKFSHNPDVERKVEKRNLYDDSREQDKTSALHTRYPHAQGDLSMISSGYDGYLGRGQITEGGAFEAWKPTYYHRCLSCPLSRS